MPATGQADDDELSRLHREARHPAFLLSRRSPDGILILDLRTAVVNPTSVARVKKREAAKPNIEITPSDTNL